MLVYEENWQSEYQMVMIKFSDKNEMKLNLVWNVNGKFQALGKKISSTSFVQGNIKTAIMHYWKLGKQEPDI